MNINKGLCFRLLAVVLTFAMVFGMIPMAFASEVVNEPYTFIVKSDKTSVNVDDILTLEIIAKGSMVNANILQFTLNYAAADFSYNSVENEWDSMIKSGSEWGVIYTTPVGKESTNKSDSTKKYIRIGYLSMVDAYINEDNNKELCAKKEAVVAKIEFKANQKIDDVSDCFSLSSAKNGFLGESGEQLNSTKGHVYVLLSETVKAKKVYDMIDNLPDTISYADKSAVEAARIAYNNLGNEIYADILKGLVTNYATLQAAEATISTIEANIKGFKDAVTALKAVDLNTYKYDPDNDNLGTLIVAANTEYAKVESANLEGQVTAEKADLDNINTAYTNHKTAYEAAGTVNTLISSIGTVEYTTASKDKIDAAQSAYNALTDELAKQYVKADVLTNAVNKWNELDEIVKDFNDTIDGLVVDNITLDNEKLLGTLRNIYDNSMDSNQKAAVGEDRVRKLEACEAKIEALVEKQERIDNVKDKIDAAVSAMNGISGYDDAGLSAAKSLVKDARSAFGALTAADEIAAIDNIDTLIAAERKITNLDTAKSIDEAINNIGTVTYPDSNDAIVDARDKYNEYKENAEIIQYVKKYDILVEAEGEYRKQQNIYNQSVADEVAELIKLIPDDLTVSNIVNIKTPLDTASASFGALSPAQQALIDESLVEKLVNASAVYPKLEAAKPVYDMIEALGEITLSDKAAIEEAEAEYDALDDDVDDYVENYDKLTAARERYEQLVEIKKVSDEIEEFLKMAVAYTDEYEAELDRIQGLINGLGNLAGEIPNLVNSFNAKNDEFTDKETAQTNALNELLSIIDRIPDDIANITLADENAIKAIQEAEAKYNSLLDKTKKQFETENPNEFEKLNDAGEKYDNLEKGAQEVANEIIAEINTIGDVTLDETKLKTIENIRNKYDNNPASHEYILPEILKILEDAEAKVIELKADKAAVDNVIDLIEAIFPVEDSADFLERLNDAKDALDNLKEGLESQVSNSADIAKAETQHAKLLEVKEAIDNIPDVIEYSTECNEKIKAAEKAYEELLELDTALDEQVDGEAIKKARAEYIEKAPVGNMVFVPEYGNNGLWMAVYTNIPANRSVKLGAYDATMVELDGNIYYVVLTNEELNTAEVVISETAAPAVTQIIGDVDGSGRVTTTDAMIINQKAARLDVDLFVNDPMSYVRADVNGSGTFTALDALMSVKIFAQDENTYSKLHVGYINPHLSK
ncbi:MAG: hypothetical protein J6D26_00190 [Clostridia bacterium]|nr:hypothetical protein [Clostridia bacterium]